MDAAFKRLLALVALAVLPSLAWGQSNPGLYQGQVPTAAQWNAYFSAKQDLLTGPLAPSLFPAFTGPVYTSAGSLVTAIASGAVGASNLASGAAASNVGALGGDLSGSLPNPTVVDIGHIDAGLLGTAYGGTGLASFTRSGNTTEFGTISGALTPGDCLQVDASDNIADHGSPCGSGGSGGGTVTSVGMTVPSGLAVSGAPITASGTLAITWSGQIPASSLPTPTGSALGGVESATAPANEFGTGINTSGVPTFAQPAFSNLSGIAAASQGGTGVNASSASNGSLLIGNGSGFSLTTLTAGQNVTIANSSGGITISAAGGTVPTISILTSSSGTYYPPSGVVYLVMEGCGGGAGGNGGGFNSPGLGGAGGVTSIGGILTAYGGNATASLVQAAEGGSASGGYRNVTGAPGYGGSYALELANAAGSYLPPGGNGASSPLGTGGVGGYLGGTPQIGSNFCEGGGGGQLATSISPGPGAIAGSGGSAGGYFIGSISSPASSYTYNIGPGGSGGSAGTQGTAGANGGQGVIYVYEYYQP